MSSLNAHEKRRLERLLRMSSGYVLDFTNRTFYEFVHDIVGIDIFDAKYDYGSGSKANRLRAFWSREPDHVVARLLSGLLDARESPEPSPDIDDCTRIVERLRSSAPVQDLDALEPNAAGREFDALAKSVREAIQNSKPEEGLDRLHTFVVKYVRVLCDKHEIDTSRHKPMHSLFGEYLRSLKRSGLVESEMAERILKSTISILEAFNDVRNNRSFAHDNPLLAYHESLLIFNNVATAIRFLTAVEEVATIPAAQPGSVQRAPNGEGAA